MRTNKINLISLIMVILLVVCVYAPPAPVATSTGGSEGVDDWEDMSNDDKKATLQSNPSALNQQQFQEAWDYMDTNQRRDFVATASDAQLQVSWNNIPYEDQQDALLYHPERINSLTESQAEEFIAITDWTDNNGLVPVNVMEEFLTTRATDATFNDPEMQQAFEDYFSSSAMLMISDYGDEFLNSRTTSNVNFVIPTWGDLEHASDISFDAENNALVVNGDSLDLSSLNSYGSLTVDIVATDETSTDPFQEGASLHEFNIMTEDGSPIQVGGSDLGAITLVGTQYGGEFAFSLFPPDLAAEGTEPLPNLVDTSGLTSYDGGRSYQVNEETGLVEWYNPSTGQFLGTTGSLAENPPGAASTVEIVNNPGNIVLDVDGTLAFDENSGAEVVFTQGDSEVTVSAEEEEPEAGSVIPAADGQQYVITGEGEVGDISTLTEEEIQELIDSGAIEEADTTGMPEDGCPPGTYWNTYLGACTSSGSTAPSTFTWTGASDYSASGRQNIQDGDITINNKGGDIDVTPSVITAEDATLYYDDEVVSGSFIITRDPTSGNIESMTVMPPASGRAIIQNDDANIDIRFDQSLGAGSASVTVDYDSSGEMSQITATGSDGSEIEVYFGPDISTTERTYYVRGQQFTISLEQLQQGNLSAKKSLLDFTNPITGFTIGDFDVNNSLYVSNVTLESADALFRYLPAKYEVKSSKYGSFEEKVICFLNCSNINIDNSVYVRDDLQGVISIGTMGSIVIDYEGNSREVFDLNSLLLTKDSDQEFTSNFNTIVANSIPLSGESDLLFRLNRESKRNLSIRESLETQGDLYYQNAAPASFTDLNEKVSYIDNDDGYIELNLFTYVVDDRRKLVLNRFSYNNMIELNTIEDMPVEIPVITTVIVDNDITYFLESDLSLQPNVYNNSIFFRSPDDVKQDYGELAII